MSGYPKTKNHCRRFCTKLRVREAPKLLEVKYIQKPVVDLQAIHPSSDPTAAKRRQHNQEEQPAARKQVFSPTLEIRSYQQVDRIHQSVLNKVKCREGVWSDEVRCRDGVLNKVRCREGVWSDEVGCCDGVFNKVRCRDGVWSDEVRCRIGVFNKVRCREGVLKHGGTNTTLPQVTEIYFWQWRLTSWCYPVLLSQIFCINRQLDVQYRVP